jgi:hypothetical protein
MEKIDIEEKQGFDMLYVRKRNVEIQVIATDKIPEEVPNDALIAYATFSNPSGEQSPEESDKNFVMAFCILNPDAIEYETFLFDNLVRSAIDTYFESMFDFSYDQLDFSKGYKARYLDSRPLDPDLLPPELLAYIIWKESDQGTGLDFYEWKDLKIKSALN